MADAGSSVPIPPGGALGVLGGGQLGRMLAMAAARLGLKTVIYSDVADPPAAACAADLVVAAYDDLAALKEFCGAVDAVTFEFENVPAETIEAVAAWGAPVAPNARALRTAQDRLLEKTFVRDLGGAPAPFAPVDGVEDLAKAIDAIGLPAILKTRRFGYDGKGQSRLSEADRDDGGAAWRAAVEKAWDEVGAAPSILEGVVDFSAEISIIGARDGDGEIRLYDAAENRHEDGILRRSRAPAEAARPAQEAAAALTRRMLTALDYVGVIGVEFFVARDGGVLVNEFAPRVHNSGHWTLDACVCDQFEQHVRAVCGWPLGDVTATSSADMRNLLGEEADAWRKLAAEPGACLHLYGKRETRPGRKMGHVTLLGPLETT
ncbi:MAG: 5-(carboxyamino)imidazole ribonucleotide synthase [Parvularculaceae bacterium]